MGKQFYRSVIQFHRTLHIKIVRVEINLVTNYMGIDFNSVRYRIDFNSIHIGKKNDLFNYVQCGNDVKSVPYQIDFNSVQIEKKKIYSIVYHMVMM